MLIPYSQSVVSKTATNLFNGILNMSKDNLDYRLDRGSVDFLVDLLNRKVSTDYKTPISRLNFSRIIPIYDPSKKIALPISVPIMDSGKLKMVFNLHPHFRSPDSIDNTSLLYKMLIDATIQENMYENVRYYSTKTEFVDAILHYYEVIFMMVFKKLLSFNDSNKDLQDILRYSIRFYAAKVLLNKPSNMSHSLSGNTLKNIDKDLLSNVMGGELDRISSFEDFYKVLSLTIFADNRINNGSSNITNYNSFIKTFAITFPTLVYGIDMLQVMTGNLFGYMKSKTYSGDYISLSKNVFTNKVVDNKFNKIMISQ